jgi:hypothetical protein
MADQAGPSGSLATARLSIGSTNPNLVFTLFSGGALLLYANPALRLRPH